MSVKLHIKQIKPYKEISPSLDGKTLPVKFGIKVYDSSSLDALREEYTSIATNDNLELALAKLQKLEEAGDRTSEEYYTERNSLRSILESETQIQKTKLEDFYKQQVLFIKGASFEYEDASGNLKDITVADSRMVAPIESLWQDAEECLAVLLDTYFEIPAIKDSLSSKIVDTVLNLQLDEKVKN